VNILTKAFTVVEIIVVLAIVAIVSAITFSVGTSAKKAAFKAGNINSLKQTYLALSLYDSDYSAKTEYGESAEMGLPNTDQFYKLVEKNNIKFYAQSGASGLGPIYYPVAKSDVISTLGNDSYKRLDTWLSYVREQRELSILIADFNLSETCRSSSEMSCLFTGHGVSVTGNLVTRRSTGLIWSPYWWK
jgi:prepilin-type N-terminal cleavage/methylation domain-containing protein